jgi:hypothetical protein
LCCGESPFLLARISYLLRLVKEFQPEFLLNDWTFSVPQRALAFNRCSVFLATLLPIEILGWVGRFAVWTLVLKILLQIGRLWEIPLWKAALGVALWLAIGQSLVADEWIVGGFEAKGISYIFLLSALYYFSLHQTILLPSFWALPSPFIRQSDCGAPLRRNRAVRGKNRNKNASKNRRADFNHRSSGNCAARP